jgi:hypothetical protein
MFEKYFPAQLFQSTVQGQKLLSVSTLEKNFRFKATFCSIIRTSGMNRFFKKLEVTAKMLDDRRVL